MATGKTNRTLSTHDRKVRQVARELEKQGYTVRADIRGRKQPHPVGPSKLVPDIEAIKDGRRKIVEVETPTSLKTDKEQLKAFARYASQKKGTAFDIVVTQPRKR